MLIAERTLNRDPSDILECIVTPYSADTIESFLDKLNLHDKHLELVHKLHFSFPMGKFPSLQHMVIFTNYVSDLAYTSFISNYLDEEVAAARMSGPLS